MIINSRRDAGYTIISRFEFSFRQLLAEGLAISSPDFRDKIPSGIIKKCEERKGETYWSDAFEFFDETDFPDLKEISLYKDNYQVILKNCISKNDFTYAMDELYALRCKIAHVKGYFTSVDLDKLIELSSSIANSLPFKEFNNLLSSLKSDPNSVVVKIPIDFIEDRFFESGIINNIPVPDYEYEGGFVGRDEDIKKIMQYLESEKFTVISITGSGGVGKTALALRVLQNFTDKYKKQTFDAIIWLSAKENKLSALGIEDIEPTLKSYEELLDTIIGIFDFQSDLQNNSIESKEQFVNEIIDICSKMLIVIDNLETITDQRIINFIFDAPLKVKFLITSRKGIGQLERRYELKELKAKEAVFLFRQICKDKQLMRLVALPDDIILKYVSKVSFYPLAIKWVVGQVARGKDINKVIDDINTTESDISKFCYERIFATLSENSKKILYTISLLNATPTASIIQYVIGIEDSVFDDLIEELILCSLLIPEQFQNEKKEIITKYTLLPLTKGYTRIQLNKNIEIRENLNARINQVESTVTTTERAAKEYKHSLYNYGAKTDEEKIATIIAQTAFQKYQSGNYDAAIEEYKRAIKVAPHFSPIYRNWAIMESYENHLSEAEKLMDKAAQLDPKDPQIFLIWGNIYRKSRKDIEAQKKYTIAYSLAPDDPIILNAYGQSKSRLGEFEEANVLLQKAIQPGSIFTSIKHEIINRTSIAENYINWGDFFYRDRNYSSAENKYTDAINECDKILKINTKDIKVYDTISRANLKLGILYLKLGDDKSAKKHLFNVIEYPNKTFKQGKLKLVAISELGTYFKNTNRFNELKKMIEIYENDFKFSQILKTPENVNLKDKLNSLRTYIDTSNLRSGFIKTVNIDRGFVIIEENNSNRTYLGHIYSFDPKISEVENWMKGKDVIFMPNTIITENAEKYEATRIKLMSVSKRISSSANKRHT